MKKSASFYVVYPADEKLREVLNILKLIADENQRTEAHITVRGPYTNQLPETYLSKISETISNEIIKINNVDNFFKQGQNTVFYKCDQNEALKSIWKKLNYNEFIPHITIYDGKDRDLALKIFNILNNNFNSFCFHTSSLKYLESKNKYSLNMFYLKNLINHNTLEELLDIDYNTFIKHLNIFDYRIKYIEKVSIKLNELVCKEIL